MQRNKIFSVSKIRQTRKSTKFEILSLPIIDKIERRKFRLKKKKKEEEEKKDKFVDNRGALVGKWKMTGQGDQTRLNGPSYRYILMLALQKLRTWL